MDKYNPEVIDNHELSRVDFLEEEHKIMCVIWKGDKLGAGYYNLCDNCLYVYEEYVDVKSDFPILKNIYREVNPRIIVCIGSSTDLFTKALVEIISNGTRNTTSSDLRSLPPNFHIISSKEYSHQECKAHIQHVDIASFNADSSNDVVKELYIQSLINFDCKLSIYAAGALIRYLERNWAIFSSEKELKIMHVHQVSVKKHVLIDWTSFNALQIFCQKAHEAGFKRGVQSNSREGLSLFKTFSSHCKSRIGQWRLRDILRNPINDMDELNKRLDFIHFALNPEHKELIDGVQDNIKHLVDVNNIIREVLNSTAKSNSWHILYKTIFHMIIINELCKPVRNKSILLSELNTSISTDLLGLYNSIHECLDFTSKYKYWKPTIKFGMDPDLDFKKLRRQDISKVLTAAARIAVEELPDYLAECAIVYLPEVGHLVSVEEWEPNCDPTELNQLGYVHMFTVGSSIHYKTPLCIELDEKLGDINSEIVAHENRIIQRLSRLVLKYNQNIRKPLKMVALLDSLIAFAKVALDKNLVKPNLNDQKIQEIEESRHPLMEDSFPGFVSNDFRSGGRHSHMKIVTGPNGSGKSVYLKQIGMIVYLAHVGSYVPAKRANIGLFQSIHFRVATESVSLRLSAFMIDVTQVAKAMNNTDPSSLIIMDEFGKGTTGEEGIALMAAVLRHFLKLGRNCPHILVSTHFQKISKYIENGPTVDFLKMDYAKNDNGQLIWLFKLTEGVSESFALDIAEACGLGSKLVNRAKEILYCLKNDVPIEPLQRKTQKYVPENVTAVQNFEENLEIPFMEMYGEEPRNISQEAIRKSE